MSVTDEDRRSSRWIPFALFGCFGALILADLGFVVLAAMTDPGVRTENAYEKGLAHNLLLARAEQQAALGWTAAVAVLPTSSQIEIGLSDRAGGPVAGADLTGRLIRPTESNDDFDLVFVEFAPGRYRAAVSGLAAGTWELAALAERADERFQVVERIYVR